MRQHAGRLAFTFHDRPSIALMWYVYADGWIYARMANDGARSVLQHNQWIAFEVDEVASLLEWRSVTLHGSVQFLENDQTSADWKAFNNALAALRAFAPWVRTAADPFPDRTQLYRIYVDDLTGREARPSGA
jgi:nitroimidazol reductase NimA-like FMN-containing flavoprotein (pyridoxamine 5'-phosphate oxidase superfamily)